MQENTKQDIKQDLKQDTLVKPIVEQTTEIDFTSPPILAAAAFIIILGAVSGFLLAGKAGKTSISGKGQVSSSASLGKGTVVGSSDTKTFRDSTEGVLKEGGIDGEGSHHLERPGGASQTVYLTSSIVDLDQFIDKKVKVWGETNKARKAGWLMDVGKVEILE